MADRAVRARRPPPPFRRVSIEQCERLSPYMVRVSFQSDELAGFDVPAPAASIRLLIGEPNRPLTIPQWTGNEFLYVDGSRPVIRTFTPRRWNAEELRLDVEVVLHPDGAVSGWVRESDVGAPAAISGPGRGYSIDQEATGYVLAGDETALPAMSQLLESIPQSATVRVIAEIRAPDARLRLTDRLDVDETWVVQQEHQPPGTALVEAVRTVVIEPGTKVWAAGEAGAMFSIRQHLFEELELSRADATVRGYWKLR